MTDGDPSPPYLIEPGTNVRLFSDYDGAERRLGESPLTSSATSPLQLTPLVWLTWAMRVQGAAVGR